MYRISISCLRRTGSANSVWEWANRSNLSPRAAATSRGVEGDVRGGIGTVVVVDALGEAVADGGVAGVEKSWLLE